VSVDGDPKIDAEAPCDLCSLPVGGQPFLLLTAAKKFAFCCEGCKGIYQMLHDIKGTPSNPGR
jgi:hypothetical protein